MKNPFKRPTSQDVADECARLAAETTDPELKDKYLVGVKLAEQGLVPPHIKGSVYSSKGRGTKR
ncbi:hypothetical protein [Streptomyces sp. NPDC091212]|uniref:hypothetical protein n=1 Tax=Streptomyces sp. NPDC091212 TaxID=3155191 RepID=UPI00341742B6